MSAAETAVSAQPARWAATPRRRFSTRFLRSELWLIFGRRRNWAGLAVLSSVPVIVATAVKISPPRGGGRGEGPDFFSSITSNGLFVALAALALELPLFLPVAVAAISADSIAGEANLGTLRYLLAVPVRVERDRAVRLDTDRAADRSDHRRGHLQHRQLHPRRHPAAGLAAPVPADALVDGLRRPAARPDRHGRGPARAALGRRVCGGLLGGRVGAVRRQGRQQLSVRCAGRRPARPPWRRCAARQRWRCCAARQRWRAEPGCGRASAASPWNSRTCASSSSSRRFSSCTEEPTVAYASAVIIMQANRLIGISNANGLMPPTTTVSVRLTWTGAMAV